MIVFVSSGLSLSNGDTAQHEKGQTSGRVRTLHADQSQSITLKLTLIELLNVWNLSREMKTKCKKQTLKP